MNAVERKPDPTRVLNPNASESSYKPKQRSYRKTNIKIKVLAPDSPGVEMSGAEMSNAETAAQNRQHRISGAETYPTLFGKREFAIGGVFRGGVFSGGKGESFNGC